MTTQSWPDPKRPGVPMFPERDGAHAIEVPGLESTDLIYYWHQNGGGWTEYNYQNADDFLGEEDTSGWIYKGPVLTPTQINEMLAAERERAARTAQEISDKYYNEREKAYHQDAREYADERMCAASECAKAIRNLGAAP